VSESHPNSIAIFDAIPDGELNTARQLREDVKVIASALNSNVAVKYFRTESISALSTIRRDKKKSVGGRIKKHGADCEVINPLDYRIEFHRKQNFR